jgi:hypothetical protein
MNRAKSALAAAAVLAIVATRGVGGWAAAARVPVEPSPAAAAAPAASVAPAAPAPAAAPAAAAAAPDPEVLLGPITREQVEAAVPAWVQAGVDAKPDLAAAQGLAGVAPGAEVTVLLGTWCSDSRREISRLWKALDGIGASAGGGAGSGLPFTVIYVGVDEAKQQPEAAVAAAGLKYVPTLIVRRGGREVGRIVESSPHGVEIDLLALLDGKAAGLLTASPKMKAAGSAATGAPPHSRQ